MARRDGTLAAAITRAGGLSFEAVREDLEPALLQFVEHATRERIKDLETITKSVERRARRRLRACRCDGRSTRPAAIRFRMP